jgi:hypothetical protein
MIREAQIVRSGFGRPTPYRQPPDSSSMARSLSFIEMLVVQRRNPVLDDRIKDFLWQVDHFGGYDRVLAVQFPNKFVIPPWGITYQDNILGEILVHPDARGDLRMVAGITPEIKAAVNAAQYHPEGTTALDLLDDLTRGARMAGGIFGAVGDFLPAAGVFLAGLGVFLLLK